MIAYTLLLADYHIFMVAVRIALVFLAVAVVTWPLVKLWDAIAPSDPSAD